MRMLTSAGTVPIAGRPPARQGCSGSELTARSSAQRTAWRTRQGMGGAPAPPKPPAPIGWRFRLSTPRCRKATRDHGHTVPKFASTVVMSEKLTLPLAFASPGHVGRTPRSAAEEVTLPNALLTTQS